MVHALSEIHRVLHPRGELIDLRPINDHWPVEISSSLGINQTGRLIDYPKILEDDKASEQAMEQASTQGWFTLHQKTTFPYYYYWDTPMEMEKYLEEEWEGEVGLDETTKITTRSTWASAGPDARPRLKLKMLIARWNKI